jgi:uncharacterized protein (DUF1786 family)
MQPEVGVTAAVVAVVASPQVRRVVRRGAVLGLAGVLMAGDAITSFTRGLSHGAQQTTNGAAAHPADVSTTVDATQVTEEPAHAEGDGAQF